jgi:hypothetical protein
LVIGLLQFVVGSVGIDAGNSFVFIFFIFPKKVYFRLKFNCCRKNNVGLKLPVSRFLKGKQKVQVEILKRGGYRIRRPAYCLNITDKECPFRFYSGRGAGMTLAPAANPFPLPRI